MSTFIHTPHEFDTALDSYSGDINSAYFSHYDHYGLVNFMELARRLEVVETRAVRIMDQFDKSKDE